MNEPHLSSTRTFPGVTFPVSDVVVPDELLDVIPYRQSLEFALRSRLEACSDRSQSLVFAPGHALLGAIHLAFALHYPLILSPDHVWLLICQGFARHVHENAETLRSCLVSHQGQMKLEVTRPQFRKGAPDNDWEGVFADFSRQIQAKLISDVYDLVVARFSTTGTLEKAAFEITLMDTVRSYFTFGVSLCGIPSITLEGSPADWLDLLERTRRLSVYDLEWWIESLLPLLEGIAQSAAGHVNPAFWQSFYKAESRSGGPFITGWLRKFFPYVLVTAPRPAASATTFMRNLALSTSEPKSFVFTPDLVSSGLSVAPFTWEQPEKTYAMAFLAGFVGIVQDPGSKALRPEIGWATCDVSDSGTD